MLNCKGCAYQREIPGNCHIRCAFDWKGQDMLDQRPSLNSKHGARWFTFPYNYDPVWSDTDCPARSETLDPDKEAEMSPMEGLLSLMG